MAETCERMIAAGLPLWRVGVFVRTLHPDIYGRNFIWKPGSEVEIGSVDFNILQSPDFHASPLIVVFQQEQEVRARIDDPSSTRFPIVDELRAEGVTDYVALPLPFIGGTVNASSWTTKQPGGFTDEQLAALTAYLQTLQPPPPLASLDENTDVAALARGKAVFEKHQCGNCHAGASYTSAAAYDVDLSDKLGQREFNPPSLLGVGHRDKLFHDNRATSLEDVFLTHRHQLKHTSLSTEFTLGKESTGFTMIT